MTYSCIELLCIKVIKVDVCGSFIFVKFSHKFTSSEGHLGFPNKVGALEKGTLVFPHPVGSPPATYVSQGLMLKGVSSSDPKVTKTQATWA